MKISFKRREAPVDIHFSASVLIVDDEALVCTLTAENLRELGLTVAVANSGAKALAALSDGLRVDLLITDIRMPEMDGYELSRRAVALAPDLKVIYMTGYTLPRELPEKALPGAPIIAKPFTTAKLAELLKQVLQRST
jgi:CheY-like chemotaxis protein